VNETNSKLLIDAIVAATGTSENNNVCFECYTTFNEDIAM